MNKVAAVLAVYLVLALVAGCTSDPDTPLGSEFMDDGLIESRPGEVFQDTFPVVSGDSTFPVNALMTSKDRLLFGRKDGFESWMIVRPDLSTAGEDTLLTVDSAWLRFAMINADGAPELGAVFYELAEPFAEKDTVFELQLGEPIPDEELTNTDRVMTLFPPTYQLSSQIVQDWLRGDRPNNGIAVVLNDTADSTRMEFGSRYYPSPSNDPLQNKPLLQVVFANGKQSTYKMLADGTFVRDLETTDDHLLSDGVTRRVLIPVDLSIIDPETFVHEATLDVFIVPDSRVGSDFSITLYIPDATDINDPAVLTGTLVTSVIVPTDFEKLKFSVRNALQIILSEGRKEAAFAIRYSSEGTSQRRMEFYTSSAPDSLRPTYRFTLSTPAVFGN